MSTTVEDAKKRVKDEIEADADEQKKANDEAAQTQIDANNTAAQTRKDNFADQVKTANKNLTNRANADKDDTYAKYDEIYDTNAVNQYISEERVAENMANLGLTNGGLNATQLTAIETSRGNADNRARLQEQKAIETIELELAANIAQNEQSMLNYNADVDADLEERNAAILAGVQSQNAKVDADANAAINAAWKDIDDAAAKTIQDATDTRAEGIKAATTAVKNLNAGEKNTNNTISQIKYYADYYGLSETEIRTMCSTAGIDYNDYKIQNQTQSEIEDYLSSYKVTEYGGAKLIDYLVTKGILLETDEEYIAKFYTDEIKNKYSISSQVNVSKKINTLLSEGKISANAATYMKAMMKHHGMPLYEKVGILTDEAIFDTAEDYNNEHPDVASDSRTLDYWLAINGYSGEYADKFKAYLYDVRNPKN